LMGGGPGGDDGVTLVTSEHVVEIPACTLHRPCRSDGRRPRSNGDAAGWSLVDTANCAGRLEMHAPTRASASNVTVGPDTHPRRPVESVRAPWSR
jgi:hypothetical protein